MSYALHANRTLQLKGDELSWKLCHYHAYMNDRRLATVPLLVLRVIDLTPWFMYPKGSK